MDLNTITYDVCRCFVRDYEGKIDPDITKRILGWVRSRNLASLSTCSDYWPEALQQVDTRRFLMQVEAFFKKNAVYSDSERCEAQALSSFHRAEKICRITNRRLDYYYLEQDRLDPDLKFWLSKAEEYVTSTLGGVQDFLNELPRRVRVTAGATLTRSRRQAYPHLKISRSPVCSTKAAPYLHALCHYFGYEKEFKANLQDVNRVEFVPKNWKTARTIACEPEGNIPLQLAFDSYAKDRLRKRGIDLSDQSRNQRMAYEASLDGKFATVDLSMASDTLSFNTVAALLPREWFEYLNNVRSSKAMVAGSNEPMTYAKFSSMGNGATFALETLIFASACRAVGSRNFSVYGDDIIIETELVPNLLRFMKFLGFVINSEKSFWDGPFRESCGAHYHKGMLVTPFYLREWTLQKSVLSHNVNGLASIACPGGQLESLATTIAVEQNLKLVPFNEDSMSGVFIDIASAYSLKLFRQRGFIQKYKAYKPKTSVGTSSSVRSLVLWNLDKFRRESADATTFASGQRLQPRSGETFVDAVKKRDVTVIRSRYTISSHKYVRKWVHWIPPVAVTPVHLYGWTEALIRARS